MAVTKRIRFEVLRRDGHTCRYCRSTDNPLTVDHVTPVALGGTDDPSNLVAACKDCNAGKSSASPDGSLVADVREEAIRHAEMIKQAYAIVVQRMGEREEYVAEFAAAFPSQPVPRDWRNSVGRWFEMGVPIELVVDAAEIALNKTQNFQGYQRFTYLCGIVWNQVHAVNEAVELKSAILGAFMSKDDLDQYGQYCWRSAHDSAFDRWAWNDEWHQLLCSVVEGSYKVRRERHERNSGGVLQAARGQIPDRPADPWAVSAP